MKNESIYLLSTYKEKSYFLLIIFILLCCTLFFEYYQYREFKKEELLKVEGKILNIYSKKSFDVLKIKTSSATFFTSIYKKHSFKKSDFLSMVIITQKVSFFEFLKGFYAKSMLYSKVINSSITSVIIDNIHTQHESLIIKELFSALFLAVPLNSSMRDFFANLGISHLIAISGFHLGVLSFCIYGILNFLYSPIHKLYFPFRNKRFDMLILSALFLSLYLFLTGIIPSLLRAFIMFVMGVYFLRCNIKVVSFDSLSVVLLIILALFPSYLFSLSLWFSIIGVFYIFLFIMYFQNSSKWFLILFFNIWIFLSFNPIVHYFFPNTSYEQLLSPLITLLFTLFYPIELLAHLLQLGSFLDEYLLLFLNYRIDTFEVSTPLWFFIIYVAFSLLSVVKKEAFYLLNLLLISFNIYLYL